MKIGIIGAGAAGLCAAKNGIEFGCEVTVFEQTNDIGGTWVYKDQVGKDENGLDIHTSMYQGLYTNLPKEIMGYPDFPFTEQEDSYISSDEVFNYYKSYADKFGLRKFVKFEHFVVRVRPLLDESWEMIVKNLSSGKYETFIFDIVLVCNGHYWSPFIPKLKGQSNFEGKQMHTHDYRKPEAFLNEKVLVVGAGPSGTDCVIEISKFAKQVTWSHHVESLAVTHFGDNVNQKPDIKEIRKNEVVFVDGSLQECSVIIYATGYRYTFPFLSVDCGIACDGYNVQPLFQNCLNINRPTMAIIGIPNYILSNQMCDLQSRFVLTFMTGRKQLPTKDEMMADLEKDIAERRERGFGLKKLHYMGVGVHEKYYAEMARIAEVDPIKPVMTKIFAKGLCSLLHNSQNFRNDIFKVIDDENFVMTKKK